ncbi:MAG: hypothetical protein GDA46_01685 [Bdellovibrionales bacterium]|nr:hypothetical protein [Bdellovibrionales bacterium]
MFIDKVLFKKKTHLIFVSFSFFIQFSLTHKDCSSVFKAENLQIEVAKALTQGFPIASCPDLFNSLHKSFFDEQKLKFITFRTTP